MTCKNKNKEPFITNAEFDKIYSLYRFVWEIPARMKKLCTSSGCGRVAIMSDGELLDNPPQKCMNHMSNIHRYRNYVVGCFKCNCYMERVLDPRYYRPVYCINHKTKQMIDLTETKMIGDTITALYDTRKKIRTRCIALKCKKNPKYGLLRNTACVKCRISTDKNQSSL
jgi:hypothetical protein